MFRICGELNGAYRVIDTSDYTVELCDEGKIREYIGLGLIIEGVSEVGGVLSISPVCGTDGVLLQGAEPLKMMRVSSIDNKSVYYVVEYNDGVRKGFMREEGEAFALKMGYTVSKGVVYDHSKPIDSVAFDVCLLSDSFLENITEYREVVPGDCGRSVNYYTNVDLYEKLRSYYRSTLIARRALGYMMLKKREEARLSVNVNDFNGNRIFIRKDIRIIDGRLSGSYEWFDVQTFETYFSSNLYEELKGVSDEVSLSRPVLPFSGSNIIALSLEDEGGVEFIRFFDLDARALM